ncbi:hypothetical protein [Lacticaseibacillus sp. N501-2]|uniref:hypothetical protein n=1 Tax=Lacticaseibacillus salsurae TaxID=3367729 RepID=UPI0038B23729
MKTWAYRLGFDLPIASTEALNQADQVVGTAALWAKGACLLACLLAAWRHPDQGLLWGQWVLASIVIDCLYHKRVQHIAKADSAKVALLRHNALYYSLFWWVILASGSGAISRRWGMAIIISGGLAALVGWISYAKHQQPARQARLEIQPPSQPWHRWVYRWVLGAAVLDEAAVRQVDARFGMPLVGLQLLSFWSYIVPGLMQADSGDWWIGLWVAFTVFEAVAHQVSTSGLDQEVYHEVAQFNRRRRQLMIWQFVNMTIFAGALGGLAWLSGGDTFVMVIDIGIGIGMGHALYTNRLAKVFFSAKR